MSRSLQSALLRGQLTDRQSIRRYLEGGNSTITIESKSGTRFTFRFRQPEDALCVGAKPIWVSVLNGPDNESNYSFIGTIFPSRSTTDIRPSGRSRVSLDAPSAKAIAWLLRQTYLGTNDEALFGRATIWHEGRCGKCGRKLTVPESVATGFGPECSSRLGIDRVTVRSSDKQGSLLSDPELEAAPYARPQ
jgi:hypothetical protein